MRSIVVLLAEDLVSDSADSKSRMKNKRVDDDAENWSPAEETWRESKVEKSSGHFCTCRRRESTYPDESWDESNEESFCYRDRDFKASVSSSEGSLRVYYPRHSARVV